MKTLNLVSKLVVTVILLSACGTKSSNTGISKGNDPIPVSVMELHKEMRSEPVHTSGQFTTDDETFLSFKTGGVISTIMVKEGESIKKGQLLATLDLSEINALVQQATLGFEKATRDYNRAKNLQKDSVATVEQMQNAKTALDIASQQLNTAKFNQKYSEIRAVNNGFILKKFVNPGQVIGPGIPVFQTNGAGTSNWILKVGISDKQWARIKLGDKATITTDAIPSKELNAIVSNKSEGADPMSGAFSIELKLTDNIPVGLAAGLFGKANIYPSQMSEVWSIPYSSLLDGNANTGYVFVTDDNKTARKIPVNIETIEKDQVLINGGLENSSHLIVGGSAYLSDNSVITIK